MEFVPQRGQDVVALEPLDFASLKTPKSQFVTGPSKCNIFPIKQLPQRIRMVVPRLLLQARDLFVQLPFQRQLAHGVRDMHVFDALGRLWLQNLHWSLPGLAHCLGLALCLGLGLCPRLSRRLLHLLLLRRRQDLQAVIRGPFLER